MASEQGPVPSAPPALMGSLPESTSLLSTTTQTSADQSSIRSLKRSRPDSSPNSSSLTTIADAGLTVSPLAKSPRFGPSFSPRYSPAPLTGAAAMEDERRRREDQQKTQGRATSENPGHKVISSLISGASSGISRLQDAPTEVTSLSEGMSVVASSISIASPMHFDDKSENSPVSATSLGSLGSAGQTATATASTTGITSPSNVLNSGEVEPRDSSRTNGDPNAPPIDKSAHRAFTFPGNVLSRTEGLRENARGMSLPMSGLAQQLAPRSPSHKKHKCPYCETEFTRHHNLKSHLLTHSQEKPYVCQTCQMRFRRLHDLKRHSKLHTGERPHICPKCDRKFARGDALARHAKGQGGCAGRRASMGSFGGDDDYDESHIGDDGGMDGVMYAEANDQNEGEMDEEERRYSLPSIKAQHVGPSHGVQENYAPHVRAPSTYPPGGPRQRQQGGPSYQTNAEHGSLNTGPSTGMQSSGGGHSSIANMSTTLGNGGPSMFSQNQMTESPKPISPTAMNQHQLGHDPGPINRQRSPSLAAQLQQQNFGRRQSERLQSPQGMSLPSPHGPKLPAISGLAPPESRYTLPSQVPGQQPSTNGAQASQHGQQGQQPTSSNLAFQAQMTQPSHSRGGSIHQQGSGSGSGSGDSSNNLFSSERGVWTYVQNLEEKVKQLSDRVSVMEKVERTQEEKIGQLTEEVAALRNQLKQQQGRGVPAFNGHMQQ